MGDSVSKASGGISVPADGDAELENPIHEKHTIVENFVSNKQGEAFAQLVKENTPYGEMFQSSLLFEVHINRKGLHWYLLFKLENSEFPFVTFEIITNDGRTISALVCIQEDDTGKEQCTSVNTTMEELCSIADTTRNQMNRYNLIERNCQHFCNAVLSSIPNATLYDTTCGPQLPDGLAAGYNINNDGDHVQFDDKTVVEESLRGRLA